MSSFSESKAGERLPQWEEKTNQSNTKYALLPESETSERPKIIQSVSLQLWDYWLYTFACARDFSLLMVFLLLFSTA